LLFVVEASSICGCFRMTPSKNYTLA